MNSAPYTLNFVAPAPTIGMKTRMAPALGVAALAWGTQQSHAALVSGVGGDTMATATVISLQELADGLSCAADTLGADNSFANPVGGTLPFAYNGPDEWFTFTVPVPISLNASLNLTGSTGDLVMFLLSAGGTNTNVIAHSQDAIGAGAGPEIIPTQNLAAGTYFLVIDSYYAAPNSRSAGTYTLIITPTVGVPEPGLTGMLMGALGWLGLRRKRRA